MTIELLDPSGDPATVFDEGAARFTIETEAMTVKLALGLGDLRYAIRPVESRG